MKKLSGNQFGKFTYWFVLLSFIIPIGYLIDRLAITEDVHPEQMGYRSRADYALMLAQCILGAIVIHVPQLFRKYLKIDIPAGMCVMYIGFLYCAIFLGEVRSFYYRIPRWDKWLHGFSAVMAGSLGFILVDILNRSNRVAMTLSPVFTAMFAFCFATSVGMLWEIYEYAFDGLLGLNMQKFMLENGTRLVGRAALDDTMQDIIIDCCGSLAAATAGYFSAKRRQKNDLNRQAAIMEKPIETTDC